MKQNIWPAFDRLVTVLKLDNIVAICPAEEPPISTIIGALISFKNTNHYEEDEKYLSRCCR